DHGKETASGDVPIAPDPAVSLLDAAVDWADALSVQDALRQILTHGLALHGATRGAAYLEDGGCYRRVAWTEGAGDSLRIIALAPSEVPDCEPAATVLGSRGGDREWVVPLEDAAGDCVAILRMDESRPGDLAAPAGLHERFRAMAGRAVSAHRSRTDADARIHRLMRVGTALTSLREPDDLLRLIVTEARELARCDGATLYVRSGDDLELAVWQNDTLRKRGQPGERIIARGRRITVGPRSIAGYVASTGQALKLADAYDLPADADYELDRSWDASNDYRTRSLLCVPMVDPMGATIGVMQLINAQRPDGQITTFAADVEHEVECLASQAAVALRNSQLHQRLLDAYLDTILRLSVAAEYRDHDTASHLERMSRYAQVIGRCLALPEERCELLRLAAPMHDIGKLGVPDSVLLKPGKLDTDEWMKMREHTVIGANILQGSDAEVIQLSATIALTHHERWDGTGYPDGLAGEAIPFEGRIVALADAFDCICSTRVYKSGRGFDEALEIVRGDAGTHFDPACVEALVAGLEEIRAIHNAFRSDPNHSLG
ncbi:MAG: HD domain-containing protein, partial [Armatimonadia bacterium]|nr:HD domain-containing protein [Armatimonadia bacterium]